MTGSKPNPKTLEIINDIEKLDFADQAYLAEVMLRRLKLKTQKPNPKKALEILDEIEKQGPDPRFIGKTEEEIIQMIKKTREDIWNEKLAPRT